MRIEILGCLSLFAFASSACEVIESKNVRTDGIYADLDATATSSGVTRLEARLKAGGSASNTFLDLSEGDRLVAYAGSEAQPMGRHEALGMVWYSAEFATVAENTLLRVDFQRTPHDMEEAACRGESAPNSMIALPAPIEMEKPLENSSFSRATDLTIEWSPAGRSDPIAFDVLGDCIKPIGGAVDGDPGRLVIRAGEIRVREDRPSGTTCTVSITLRRSRNGLVDPAYGEGGSFEALQVRTRNIQSTP